MSKLIVPLDAKEASIGVVVIRKDGRIEDLGTVAYWHRSRWRRAMFHVRRFARWIGCR